MLPFLPVKQHRTESAAAVVVVDDDDSSDLDDSGLFIDVDDVVETAGPSIRPSPAAVGLAEVSQAPRAVASPAVVAGIESGVRVPVSPKEPHRGWLLSGRIPESLHLGQRNGKSLEMMLALLPEEHGQVLMYGKLVDVPRYQKVYGRDQKYTGVMHPVTDPYPDAIAELLHWANEQRHDWTHPSPVPISDVNPLFNCALVNWYLDGQHYIGPHSDEMRDLHPHSPIFSLSLGQTRLFRVRERKGGAIVRDIELRNGEYVVMGGLMQQEFKHEVVKVNGEKGKLLGPRVNITFRQFV